ncbi:ABC transporter ATP-binding protein, partial [Streptomyces sp. SID7982]|nr:ABC transporter ATP-binding protein [Streptomyces sp. SID7982]
MTHHIEARSITAGYGKDPVIDGLSVAIPTGRITALVGPNA